MTLTGKGRLSRRAALRGGGVTVALPILDAMVNDRGWLHATAYAQASPPPVRLIVFFLPNGFPWDGTFRPEATGPNYAVTPCLQPVAPYVGDFTVMSYIFGGSGHAGGTVSFATGLEKQGGSPDVSQGPSVEQVAGQRAGISTRFPALAVTPAPLFDPQNPILGTISWQAAGQVAPAENDPATLFARLFGAGLPEQVPDTAFFDRLRRNRQSVLDYVLRENERYRQRLGVGDRWQLDAHLTAVRELEQRLPLETAPVAACDVPDTAPAAPRGMVAKAEVMVDLAAMALRCNLTNYLSFMYDGGGGGGGVDYSILHAALGPGNYHQHNAAHDSRMNVLQAYTTEQMRVFARFLGALKTAPEAGQNLLYNSVILLGSELGNGAAHSGGYQTMLLCGHAGGQIKSNGTHVGFPVSQRLATGRIHLTMLHLCGINEPSFANQTEPLSELVT